MKTIILIALSHPYTPTASKELDGSYRFVQEEYWPVGRTNEMSQKQYSESSKISVFCFGEGADKVGQSFSRVQGKWREHWKIPIVEFAAVVEPSLCRMCANVEKGWNKNEKWMNSGRWLEPLALTKKICTDWLSCGAPGERPPNESRLRRRINRWIEPPPKAERLVLRCIRRRFLQGYTCWNKDLAGKLLTRSTRFTSFF